MREAEFLNKLRMLLEADVRGFDRDQKLAIVRRLCDEHEAAEDKPSLPACHIIPFIMGRRPTYEAAHPGLGSSHNTSLILDNVTEEPGRNSCYILYQLSDPADRLRMDPDSFSLDVSFSFEGPDGDEHNAAVPGWDHRPLQPLAFQANGDNGPELVETSLAKAKQNRFVASFSPERDFLPGKTWKWPELDKEIRQNATDARDPFTFGHLFTQQAYVELRLSHQGIPVSTTGTWVEICDARRLGSLYQRIIDRLLRPDTQRQSRAAKNDEIDVAYHPWYPVLLIGSEKAALYTSALIDDVVHDAHILTDPRWLLRVGRFLEFLTCMGIIEAVKADVGDLLTPAERHVYETSAAFAEVRRRIDPDAWGRVWELRHIAFPKFGTPRVGPVSAVNLLNKKRAILAFLETHHDDLKQALALASDSEYNAQETWLRVLRDAERAVLRKTEEAFPELTFFNPRVKELLLWHQKGKASSLRVPDQITALFGDQDGLYASACNQYRASMNEVAEWAKQRGLMDYTGPECVPSSASLLRAVFEGRDDRVARLQRTDGYAESPVGASQLPEEPKTSADQVQDLLVDIPIFQMLTTEELTSLANEARRIDLGPLERLIVQGRVGTSLFVVGDGSLEVLVRQTNGVDLSVAIVETGTVIGEMSLLTGEQRGATVRAVDGAVVYEIGKLQYEPIIRARPKLVDELARLSEARTRENRRLGEDYDASQAVTAIGRRIREFLFAA